MFRFSDRISFVKTAALLVALAAALAPAAQAADKSDAVDRSLGTPASSAAVSDAVDRHMRDAASRDARRPHGYPAGAIMSSISPVVQPIDFRSADTRDAAIGRYPDSGPVLIAAPRGFDRGDATVGMAGTVAALLIAGAIAIGLRHRKRVVLS